MQVVREAACITIGQFAQYLQPEIISHYKEILPQIFTVRPLAPPALLRCTPRPLLLPMGRV